MSDGRLLHRVPARGSHHARLRLMSDYSAPTPVWTPAELGGHVLTDLEALGLCEALRADLLAWQRYFDEHHPLDLCAWDSPHSESTYARDGHRLHEELCRSLPGCRVDLDLWSVPAEADEPA